MLKRYYTGLNKLNFSNLLNLQFKPRVKLEKKVFDFCHFVVCLELTGSLEAQELNVNALQLLNKLEYRIYIISNTTECTLTLTCRQLLAK
jgi:hypothetical protein